MQRIKKIFLIVFLFNFLCSVTVYSQFESTLTFTGVTQEEWAKQAKEALRIKNHNEWVLAEKTRLNNRKLAGEITIIVGVLITGLGGIVCLYPAKTVSRKEN